MLRPRFALALVLVLSACDGSEPTLDAGPPDTGPPDAGPIDPDVVVYVTADDEALGRIVVRNLAAEARVVADPMAAIGTDTSVVEIAIVTDLDCDECYRVERSGAAAVVHGSVPSGAQYGVAHVLESMGARFYHPERTHWPDALTLPADGDALYGVTHEPTMSVRGLHLHTLHPIEPYFAFNEPGDEALEEARTILDWLVRQRANLVHWWLLRDLRSELEGPPLLAHTRAIVDEAHARGIETGAGIQLFRGANLQRAYDLTEGNENAEAEIEESLDALDGLGLDGFKIAFGEFSGEEPARFVYLLDYFVEQAHVRWPDIDITASIHVGNYPELRVDYGGDEDLLYYFLVQHADPRITPWIHTVMYYTLFDSASLAYLHEDFSEHRGYLYDRLRDGLPVAYYPETAYWVAFDNSVPTYLPVYIRSRWRDQARIAEDVEAMGLSPLDQHVTFSSGWEWGYWQQDYLTLRSHYTFPASWEDATREMLAPIDGGAAAAEAVIAVAELQHTHLVEGELGAYMAGRDASIEAGFLMGIIAAPDRVDYEEAAALTPAERQAFEDTILVGLEALADGTEAALATVPEGDDPWVAEIRDGLEVDVWRGRFIVATYRAVLAHAAGEDAAPSLAAAEAALAAGRAVVERRHGALHHRPATELTARRLSNSTLYQYGYLREAHQLCFWEREHAQTRNLVLGVSDRVPACVL